MTKRNPEGDDNNAITVMANCLMLLSGARDSSTTDRVFTCKTCERQFMSFQALGGHRASHKKPRLMVAGDGLPFQLQPSPAKPKIHECSVCGLEFPIGQALGGHMRRHRATNIDQIKQLSQTFLSLERTDVPVVKKVQSDRRVLWLDLNLTPSENRFVFGQLHVPGVDFV